MNYQTLPDHRIQRIYKIAKTRLYPFFRDPRDMIRLRYEREKRLKMALILIGKLTPTQMVAELAAIPEKDRLSGLITYRQLTMARHLWKVSEYEAERRLNAGELPDAP